MDEDDKATEEMWVIRCDLMAPITWSRMHPTDPIPYELWLTWHAAHLLPDDAQKDKADPPAH